MAYGDYENKYQVCPYYQRLVSKSALRDTPRCLDASLYVWMPPYIWTPLYVWTSSCIFGCPHMFGHSQYVWMPLIYLDAPPVSLDTLYVWMPHMFGYSLVCLGTPMFGCPLNMGGHSHMFGCPHMFGRCLDACCTYTTQRKHALSD